jgi:putative ABC transport system permease protein
MKWRAGSSLMFFVVAVAAIMAAAAGPVYLRAADQTVVFSLLTKSSVFSTGITITPGTAEFAPPSRLEGAARKMPDGAGASPSSRFGTPIMTVEAAAGGSDVVTGGPANIQLLSRTGACAEVHFVAGACPTAPGGVALTTRTAKALGVKLGSQLQLGAVVRRGAPAKALPPLKVTGLFQAPDNAAPIWWGNNFFAFGTTKTVNAPAQLDAGLMSESDVLALAGTTPTTDWLEIPLRTAAVQATGVPSLLDSLRNWSAQAQAESFQVSTQLPSVLASAETDEHSSQTIITIVSLELFLLVLLVVYAVARATSSSREGDVRVAELRGLPRRRIVRLALREPGILLVAALPIGLFLTYVLFSFIDDAVLGSGASTALDSLAIETAVLGCLAGLVSAGFGSRNVFGDRRPEDTAEAVRQRQNRNAAVVDALGLALAAAGIAELVTQHEGAPVSPVAYLGPGLTALGAGILASRLLPALAAICSRGLSWSRRTALTLSARDLARRRDLARQLLVPTIATGLLVFAVAGIEVAAANHATQAEFQLGAPVVLTVSPKPGVNLLTAVRAADPTGREAMAVAKDSSSDGTTLLVDPSRFAAIASWPRSLSSLSASEVARVLNPPVPPERVVPDAAAVDLMVTAPRGLVPGPDMQMELFDLDSQGEFDVNFGTLRAGTHLYRSSIAGLCAGGCRLDEITLLYSPPAQQSQTGVVRSLEQNYQLRVSALGVSHRLHDAISPVPADLTRPGAWRSNSSAAVTSAQSGLEIDADLLSVSGQPTVLPYDTPSVLPVIATSELVSLDATPGSTNQVQAIGLDESQLSAQAEDVVSALPSVGASAAMGSLVLAERLQQSIPLGVTWQVWCHKPPSAAFLQRLRSKGVTLLSTERATTVEAVIDKTGPALGFDLYGVAAGGGALLALGALLFSIASDARRRRVEFAGLSAVGVPRGALLRSLLISSSALALAGAVAGTVAAIFSASFALRFLPEFPPGRVGAPLALGVPMGDVLLTGLAVFVLLELGGVAGNLLLLRGVRPDLIRLSQ